MEFLFDFFNPLCVCICDFTILLAITHHDRITPFHAIEFQIKIKDVKRMDHINECKSNITFCFEIHWEIKEIVLA